MDFAKEVFLQIGCEKFEEIWSLGFSVFVKKKKKKKKSKQMERILTPFGEMFKMDKCLKFKRGI